MLVSNAADAILLTNTLAELKVKPKAIISSAGRPRRSFFHEAAGKNAPLSFRHRGVGNRREQAGRQGDQREVQDPLRLRPDGRVVDAYAAMYVLADALERAKSLDSKAIRDAIAKTKLDKVRP